MKSRTPRSISPGIQTVSAASSGQPADACSVPKSQYLTAVGAVLAAMVLVVLNTAIANIALPTIAQSLKVTPAMSIWIVTANQAALLMALLPCATLGESLGYRRVFRYGVALFSSATLMCVLAPSLPWLIVARLLQGFGGAAVMALGIALLRHVVPSQQLGAAIGWNALAVALSSAAGPAIGAAILTVADWPWIFAVLLPLSSWVMLAARALPAVDGTSRSTDPLSMALNAGAFASLVIAAGFLTDRPLLATMLLAISAIQLTLLVKRERPKVAPLIPLDLLGARSFCLSVIASVLCFAGQTAALVALPFYLQHGLGLTVMNTGLYMLPWPLTVALVAPLAGRLANRWSTAWLCSAGGISLSAGLGGAAIWPLQGNLVMLVPLTMLCGFGFGLFNVANNRNMFLSAPMSRSGAAGGIQGTARLLGQTAGAVMMTLLFNRFSADSAPQLALSAGALLSLLAALTSMLQGRQAESAESGASGVNRN